MRSCLFALVFAAPLFLPSPASLGAQAASNPRVVLTTNLGDITILLDGERAPKTVENFLNYVEQGFYDGTIFHRVIPGFMIQAGGYLADLERKETKDPIENEATNGLANMRGTIAMARTNDIDSATSQFFINTVDNAHLNHRDTSRYGYAVFGKVAEGMSVVDTIEMLETKPKSGFRNLPIDTVTITSARILSDD